MIKANFNTYASYVTDSLYQWDINQVLSVSGLNISVVPEVHFSNANTDRAIVRQSTMVNRVVSVMIPNSLLQEALTIKAHIGIYENKTFKVVEVVEIPVEPRTRPSDYQIENSDEEIISFKALENAIANMVKVSDFNANTAAITARISNIIAHNNDTNGNTELIDIRTDLDGNIHGSAGESVRYQSQKLSNKIKTLENAFDNELDFKCVYCEGYYANKSINDAGEFVDLQYSHIFEIPCESGEVFICDKSTGYISKICFKDTNDNLVKIISHDKLDEYITVPTGASKCYVIQNYQFRCLVCKLKKDIKYYFAKEYFTLFNGETLTPDNIEKNSLYTIGKASPIAFTGYNTYNYTLERGELYAITTNRISNESYGHYGYFVDGQYTSQYFADKVSINNHIFIAESEHIKICAAIQPTITKITPRSADTVIDKGLYTNLYDNILTFKGGIYGNKLAITMKTKGPNGLFDFYTFTDTQQTELNNQLSGNTLVQNVTDFFMPFVVKAVNNGNGDHINSNYFTGGNHAYDNSASGSATAHMTNLTFKIDGVLKESYSGYCDNIVVEWDSYIQGFNTTKADGNGRSVLKTHHTLSIDNESVDCFVDIMALEDVVIEKYYGLGFYLPNSNISYVGGNRAVNKVGSGNSGSLKTSCIIGKNDAMSIECYLDKNIDLGDMTNNTRGYNAFSSDNKGYYFLIDNNFSLLANEHCYLKGKYVFKTI